MPQLSAEEQVEQGALQAALWFHKQGRGHGDIKGPNLRVKLSSDNRTVEWVKAADFGCSSKFKGPHGQGPPDLAWSLDSTCPELVSDCARDVWSIGCLLLKWMTGYQPWTGRTVSQVRQLHSE